MFVWVWAFCYRRVTGEKHWGQREEWFQCVRCWFITPRPLHLFTPESQSSFWRKLKVMSGPWILYPCLWCCQFWICAELLSMTCSRLSRWGNEGTFLLLLETEPLTLAVTSLAASWTCFKASKKSVWAKTKEEFTNFEVGTSLQLATNGNFMMP